MGNNVLVVDFSYFFSSPRQDLWLRSDTTATYTDEVWQRRYRYSLDKKEGLPYVNDEWQFFWDRFKFTEDAIGIVGDSNLFATDLMRYTDVLGETQLYLFDSYHDSEEAPKGVYDYKSWMVAFYQKLNSKLHVRYPTWLAEPHGKREEEPTIPLDRQIDDWSEGYFQEFDLLYIARSGGVVPPWCDDMFVDFYKNCPVEDLDFVSLAKDVGVDVRFDYAEDISTEDQDVKYGTA